jgi:large subunit GTPase 1
MTRRGSQGKGKPRLKDRKYGFGTALLKSQQYGSQGLDGRVVKEITNMKSVLDASHLDDYLLVAEMEGDAPEVKRVHQHDAMLIEPTMHRPPLQKFDGGEFDYKHLSIPRKPTWNREMSADEVNRREIDNFLEWRREISFMEEKYPDMKVTPFEKNIEVWRQLWRVLERCDMAVQIVDARNPLMYYTEDLMKYASG